MKIHIPFSFPSSSRGCNCIWAFNSMSWILYFHSTRSHTGHIHPEWRWVSGSCGWTSTYQTPHTDAELWAIPLNECTATAALRLPSLFQVCRACLTPAVMGHFTLATSVGGHLRLSLFIALCFPLSLPSSHHFFTSILNLSLSLSLSPAFFFPPPSVFLPPLCFLSLNLFLNSSFSVGLLSDSTRWWSVNWQGTCCHGDSTSWSASPSEPTVFWRSGGWRVAGGLQYTL